MNEAVLAVWFLLTLGAGVALFATGRGMAALVCFVMATIALVGTAIVNEMKRLARRHDRSSQTRAARERSEPTFIDEET